MLNLLRAFLHLGVEGDDPPPDDPPNDDPSLDLDLEGDPTPAPVVEPPQPTIEELRAEVERERRRAEEAERRASQAPPPQPQAPQPSSEYAKEEQELADARAKLAAGQVTPEAVSWLEWRIKQERTTRASAEASQRAEWRANDAADKADFARIERTEPRRYKFFAPKVEEIVQRFRQAGQVPPNREIIYDNLVGKAVREGTYKEGRPAATPAAPAARVDRGRMPNARSDVNPKDKSGMTDHQKRIERMKAAHARGEYL